MASVSKRFANGRRAAAAREWQALVLLDRYAPGLAPEPRGVRLDADEPEVVMGRLAGEPLRGRRLDAAQVRALADAVSRLHRAVPGHELAALAPRPGQPDELAAGVRALAAPAAERAARHGDGHQRLALAEGMAWLDAAGPFTSAPPGDLPRVLGHGDGNLSNYLWDGSRVRVLDFEYAGAADRALELAEITEHVAARGCLGTARFLAHFDLGAGERRRLALCRRLLALYWLVRLLLDDPDRPRNPPGTAAAQAVRLRALLAGGPPDAANRRRGPGTNRAPRSSVQP